MSAQDLLFELGTEELPPRALPSLSAALTEGVVKGLEAAGIPHGRVHAYATPRRLAVRIQKLAEQQPDKEVERRGPPLKNSFDPQGAPTQAAMAFAKNCGVTVTDLAQL
jgi:glycyl-tRNA synthetase beta chain